MMEESLDHNSTTPTAENGMRESILYAAHIVDLYYTPILFLFGLIGNSLSIAVFCMNAKYRNQSASYYLSALAISDTGYLVNLLAVWLETVLGGVITSRIMCPLVMYLGQVTCFISVYLTVAFSIERYVAVHYPLSRPRICTRSKARKIIAGLTATALLIFSYVWVIAQVIEEEPGGLDSSQEQSSELYPFPDEEYRYQKEREGLQNRTGATAFFGLPPFGEAAREGEVLPFAKNLLQKKCDDDSARHMVTLDESISPLGRNVSQNCSNFYSDGRIRQTFQLFNSGESKEDSSYSSMDSSLEAGSDEVYVGLNFSHTGGFRCSVPPEYFRISEIANYFDAIVTLIIPFCLITFFNVRIAVCVWKLKDQRQNIIATSTTDNITHYRHSSSIRCSSVHRGGKKKQHLDPSGNPHHPKTLKPKHVETLKRCDKDDVRERSESVGETSFSKREREMVKTQDSRSIRFSTAVETNNTTSSSEDGESEGNSVVDDAGCNKMGKNFSIHIDTTETSRCPVSSAGIEDSACDANPRLSGNGNKMSTIPSPKFLGKSSPFGRFGGRSSPKTWEQGQSQSPSPRKVTELSTVRENRSSHHGPSNAAEVRVTKTLLLVSTVFLVLNLPAHAIRCAQFIQTLSGRSEGQDLIFAVQLFSNILFNSNFGVNFLLYCLSGKNFRKSLKNMLLRKFNKKSTGMGWKPTKKGRRDYYNPTPSTSTSRFPGQKRNITKELQTTDIMELDDKTESITTFPSGKNGSAVKLDVVDEVAESLA